MQNAATMADIIELSAGGLHEQAAARLRTMLVEGRIAPGAKLNERELAEALRISRTPLREAIKMLAAEGLVDLLPNRGAVAVKLTETDVMHSFELLAELEGFSGELAAARIGDAARQELRAKHFEMMACHARGDLSGYYRLNAQIHRAINAAAKNPVLTATYNQVTRDDNWMRPYLIAGTEIFDFFAGVSRPNSVCSARTGASSQISPPLAARPAPRSFHKPTVPRGQKPKRLNAPFIAK